MTLQTTKQLPISLPASRKTDVRSQFAALCYRIVSDKVQVLLVTSRGSGRWILPKGWPMDGKTPGQTALSEAFEEAGVRGKASNRCLGLYAYTKSLDDIPATPIVVMVYPVKVKSLANTFPEAGQRRRKWVTQKKAAAMVSEPELSQILKTFDPRLLKP